MISKAVIAALDGKEEVFANMWAEQLGETDDVGGKAIFVAGQDRNRSGRLDPAQCISE